MLTISKYIKSVTFHITYSIIMAIPNDVKFFMTEKGKDGVSYNGYCYRFGKS